MVLSLFTDKGFDIYLLNTKVLCCVAVINDYNQWEDDLNHQCEGNN